MLSRPKAAIGWGWVPGSASPPPQSLRQFVVDFEAGELDGLAPNQPVQAALVIQRGEARDLTVSRLPDGGTWRVAFKLSPAALEQTTDMRLHLTLRGRRISETWSYVWNPAQVQSS
jgi:glucans biosynthesis protein